jgi:hypothetical protein
MRSSYTIDSVATHMLTMDWPYPHASDGTANFQALYAKVRKVFPSLTSHDFTAAFDRCLELRQAASNRSAG